MKELPISQLTTLKSQRRGIFLTEYEDNVHITELIWTDSEWSSSWSARLLQPLTSDEQLWSFNYNAMICWETSGQLWQCYSPSISATNKEWSRNRAYRNRETKALTWPPLIPIQSNLSFGNWSPNCSCCYGSAVWMCVNDSFAPNLDTSLLSLYECEEVDEWHTQGKNTLSIERDLKGAI